MDFHVSMFSGPRSALTSDSFPAFPTGREQNRERHCLWDISLYRQSLSASVQFVIPPHSQEFFLQGCCVLRFSRIWSFCVSLFPAALFPRPYPTADLSTLISNAQSSGNPSIPGIICRWNHGITKVGKSSRIIESNHYMRIRFPFHHLDITEKA